MNYIIEYPDENLWDEEWKKQYKYGVILCIPPSPIKEFVDNLRSKYDPKSYEISHAHISLTMPLVNGLTNESLEYLKIDYNHLIDSRLNMDLSLTFSPKLLESYMK